MRARNKLLLLTMSLLIGSSLFVGCNTVKNDSISDQKLKDKNVSFYMKVDDISYSKDVKTNATDTLVQGNVLKGEVNVGDKIKVVTAKEEEYDGTVAIIRIDKGNQDLKTAKTGQQVQMIIDDYHGGNKALFLYKNK